MPKAEVGSTKYVSNKMKSKGLQRLRWYCQVCEKQCRDANGFKMHTQSESHVRQMLIVGEDPNKFIQDFSNQFQRDFLQLLKTGHGEKQVHINHFYQEYIANKEHVHMNATKWPSLTEFAKHLGREGICRVTEDDDGIHIAWVDNSPEALRRQEALRRKNAQDQGDEASEQRMIREQIRRANAASETRNQNLDDRPTEEQELKRKDGEKIKLSFGGKQPPPTGSSADNSESITRLPSSETDATSVPKEEETSSRAGADSDPASTTILAAKVPAPASSGFGGLSMKPSGKPQVKNVFAQAKKSAASTGPKKANGFDQPKKISEAERIMREEMERKRSRELSGFGGGASTTSSSHKKQRTAP